MTGQEFLSQEDREFLERKEWNVEIKRVQVNGSYEVHIIVHNFILPAKYSPTEVDLLVRQLPGYPEAAMDMFWTRPDVVLVENGQKPPAADVPEVHDELTWQRWSRHTTWRADRDNLETFFTSVLRELNN